MTRAPRGRIKGALAAWTVCLLLASPGIATGGPPRAGAPRPPEPSSILDHAARVVRDAEALATAVEPWSDALERARQALATPAIDAAEQALADARRAHDDATPKLAAAAASFQALERAADARRVFPPAVLTAASAFRGAAGAYHDRQARQARLEQALARAKAPPSEPTSGTSAH